MSAAVDRPSPVAIALALAEMGAGMKDSPGDVGNYERSSLADAAELLQRDPPDVWGALDAAEKGCAHAFRGTWVEDRIEAWLCAALAEILKGKNGAT